MEIFSKIKSSVNQYLPGNPLSASYEIESQHIASFGPGLYWKVFKATSYAASKQEASVCLFEKKQLDNFSKTDREIILETIRKGVQQLTKLRHPRVIAVYHALEETTSALAYATEPILCSLANKVQYPTDTTISEESLQNMLRSPLHEVDIKFGFIQLCEALSFLHNDAKIVHGNICPENIILTASGDWKLSGFEFAITATQGQSGADHVRWSKYMWQNKIPAVAQPNLSYFAPEYHRNSDCSLTPASDMFSIGCLFHTVHNGGKPLLDPNDRSQNGLGKWEDFIERIVLNSKWDSYLRVPAELKNHVIMLLSGDPSVRPDPDQVIKLPYFNDVAVQTLQYLDSLVQRDLIQRSQFFRGLPKVIDKLPKHINLNKILPPLFREFTNPDMVPFLLPSILAIADMCTQPEYIKHVFPGLTPAFKMVKPHQTPLILLQHMNLLLSKTPPNDVKNHVLPMAYNALETGNETVQELCLNTLPTVSSLIDYGTLKSAIVPRIKKLATETGQVQVKVKCMVCLSKLLECMDKWFVLDHILPFLPKVKTSEPQVIMAILGIYKITLSDRKLGITKEALVNHCVPFLLHLSLEQTINIEQFDQIMSLVRQMMEQIESEQRTKLQQLALLRDQHSTLTSSMNEEVSRNSNASPPPSVRSSNSVNNFSTGSLIGTSTMVNSSSTNDFQSSKLSMEEKERLANAQRQHARMKLEPAPQPIPVSSAMKPTQASKPKDLTSSLMERELSQMSMQWPSSQSNQLAQPMTSSINWNSTNNTLQQSSTMSMAQTAFPTFPQSNQNRTPMSGTPMGMMQPQKQQQQPPPQIQQNQNQQMGDFFSSLSSNQNSKNGSNKDLLDFLG